MRRKTISASVFAIAGSLGLSALPTWSQESPRGMPQQAPEQPRSTPGNRAPDARTGGTQELSQNDMRMIQQRLEEKGYKTGNRDGNADDTTRAAIRKFQQDEGIAVTGRIDESTANRLGFRYAKGPAGSNGAGERSAPGDNPTPR